MTVSTWTESDRDGRPLSDRLKRAALAPLEIAAALLVIAIVTVSVFVELYLADRALGPRSAR